MSGVIQGLKNCFLGLTGRQLSTGIYYKRMDYEHEPPNFPPGISRNFTEHDWKAMRADRIGLDVYEISTWSQHHEHGWVRGWPLVGERSIDRRTLPDHSDLAGIATQFFEFHQAMANAGYHVTKRNPLTHYYAKATRQGWTPPQQKPAELGA